MEITRMINSFIRETKVSFSQFIDGNNEIRRAMLVSIAGAQGSGDGDGTDPVSGLIVSPYIAFQSNSLVVDTAIYAANEVLSDIIELPNFFPEAGAAMFFDYFTLLDKDDEAAFDSRVFLLNANTSLGTKNSGVTITDANAQNILGMFDIVAADAVDIGSSKFYVAKFPRIEIKAAPTSRSLWIQMTTGITATPTFTAAGDLYFNAGGYR